MPQKVRFFFFCAAVLLYAAAGYPTPDAPGGVEILVGSGLLVSLGFPTAAFALLRPRTAEPLWMKTSRLLLIYGLSAPVVMAILQGNEISAVIRDLFPFLFLLLPYFTYGFFYRLSQQQKQSVVLLFLVAGLIFAARGLSAMQAGTGEGQILDALYLVNAPTVLFAALLLGGYALSAFRFSSPLGPAFAAITMVLPVLAMAAAVQRASFGAIACSGIILGIVVLRRSLLRAVCLAGAAGVLLFYVYGEAVVPVLAALIEKNRLVGSNMRLSELDAVWERVVENTPTFLFGQGWGGTLQSPAVGGLTVNYTHSLLSAALLKTGMIGMLLTLSYLGTLFLRFPDLFRKNTILALALFWPFVIDIFLYASYKSLDFGFVLMMIACYGLTGQEHDKEADKNAQNIDDKPGLSANGRSHGEVVI
ncbi:MAG: hypothetical protein H6857_01615 [Rhodospirillales bacterium]|nr:hypothetical protein [Rhodospirillales bacterium]